MEIKENSISGMLSLFIMRFCHIVHNDKTDEPVHKIIIYEQGRKKTCLWDFRPGPKLNGLNSHRRWLQAYKLGFRKYRDCTIYEAKTKALINYLVTTQLICAFVFAYAKSLFSHDMAHIYGKCSNCLNSNTVISKKGEKQKSI